MNITVIYHVGFQIWTAYHKGAFGVGCTAYEAIGRLMYVLSTAHEDFTIEFTQEE